MSVETASGFSDELPVDQRLFEAIVASVKDCLMMCGRTASCVAVSSVPSDTAGGVTGLIGVHGNVTGFVGLSVSNAVACRAVGGLLSEEFPEMTAGVVDGVGELTNMVTGSIKARIAKTEFAYSGMTVPSLIIGRGYQLAFGKGSTFVSVTFSLDDPDAYLLEDRLFHACLSLVRV